MHYTIEKPRHTTPSSAKRARDANGADEGKRDDENRRSGRFFDAPRVLSMVVRSTVS